MDYLISLLFLLLFLAFLALIILLWKYAELNRKYTELSELKDSIEQNYAELNRKYAELTEVKDNIEQNYAELNRKYAELAELKDNIEQRARKIFEEHAELNRKYAEVKGNIEQRARQIFEEWKEKELESASMRKAEILFGEWKQRHEKELRRDAVKKSKAVITGKITEHIAPYLPEFKYNPKDARFIGSPIDFIVFDGLDEGELRRIVFIEVKSGKSTLSRREKLVRDAIEENRVEWEILKYA